MRVLITGASGFIGSHVKKHYVSKKNIEIFCWNKNSITGKDYSVELSMCNTEKVEIALREIHPNLIIHCAGRGDVNRSVIYPEKDLEENYIIVHNILFAMKKLKMDKCRFVFLSSAAVYGNPNSLPIDENTKLNPLSPYALHKLASEELCCYLNQNYGMDIKILRIFSAYGPGLKKQLFWDMYQKIKASGKLDLWGNGLESRDYIYIDDLVQAIVLISEHPDDGNCIYNVGNGEEVTIKEAAETFVRKLGLDNSIINFNGVKREGDPMNWRANINRLKNLGYERCITFESGISKYVNWIKENTI